MVVQQILKSKREYSLARSVPVVLRDDFVSGGDVDGNEKGACRELG